MKGSKRERRPGVWQLVADLGADPLTGHRRQKTTTFYGTRREADTALSQFVAKIAAGTSGPPAGRTVGQLLDRWYDHLNAGGISPTTLDGYESKIRLYLRPALGDLALSKLTTERLDALYAELSKRGGTKRKKERDGSVTVKRTPLAANTVLGVHRIIHAACEQARRWAWLERNPAELARRPEVDEQEVDPPDVDALLALLAWLEDNDRDFADVVHLGIATGTRRGQLCALRWTDLDVDQAQVTIARAIVESGGLWEERGRNRNKRRQPHTIALDEHTITMLRARRRRAAKRALACGVSLPDDAFVLSPEPDGAVPLLPQRVTSRWTRLSERHGVDCRFHDLRHFVITFLLGEGVPVRDVAERHDHADGRLTLQKYGHAIPANDQRSADLIGLLFERIAR